LTLPYISRKSVSGLRIRSSEKGRNLLVNTSPPC
jgi:hypothetical protein